LFTHLFAFKVYLFSSDKDKTIYHTNKGLSKKFIANYWNVIIFLQIVSSHITYWNISIWTDDPLFRIVSSSSFRKKIFFYGYLLSNVCNINIISNILNAFFKYWIYIFHNLETHFSNIWKMRFYVIKQGWRIKQIQR